MKRSGKDKLIENCISNANSLQNRIYNLERDLVLAEFECYKKFLNKVINCQNVKRDTIFQIMSILIKEGKDNLDCELRKKYKREN